MKTEVKKCNNCGPVPFKRLGFVPLTLIEDVDDPHWVDASVCCSCGGVKINKPKQEQIARAKVKYVSLLAERGIITTEEKEEMM